MIGFFPFSFPDRKPFEGRRVDYLEHQHETPLLESVFETDWNNKVVRIMEKIENLRKFYLLVFFFSGFLKEIDLRKLLKHLGKKEKGDKQITRDFSFCIQVRGLELYKSDEDKRLKAEDLKIIVTELQKEELMNKFTEKNGDGETYKNIFPPNVFYSKMLKKSLNMDELDPGTGAALDKSLDVPITIYDYEVRDD